MPTLKTLTTLTLVIITVLIVTVLLIRVSQPAEGKAVEGVYDQFFGEASSGDARDFLTLKGDQLVLHCERARGVELTLLLDKKRVKTCSQGREERIDLTRRGIAHVTLIITPLQKKSGKGGDSCGGVRGIRLHASSFPFHHGYASACCGVRSFPSRV